MPAPDFPTSPVRKLILVRHSLPEIDPARPAHEWRLSAEGRLRCIGLAEQLAAHRPQALVSSQEPKALETAAILGERLSLPVEPAAGLHEHERQNVPFTSRAEFEAAVRRLFDQPAERVFGDESAEQAARRFETALAPLLARPVQCLAVVTHGTVLSLYIARRCGIDAFSFWQRLSLPMAVTLSLPDFTILDLLERTPPETP